jgi:AraC-like DNA-binding protein
MDRHDVSEKVTAENVAELHQQDLKIQHKYNCRGLTYWFDDQRKTAFCLIEAPNKKSVVDMHNNAHGEVPHRVIEVDASIVESFLGRIEDPKKSQNTELNIINDPAFRTIMICRFNIPFFSENKLSYSNQFKEFRDNLIHLSNQYNGRIVKQDYDQFLISFKKVTDCIDCALQIINANNSSSDDPLKYKIGINAGAPVTEEENIFEECIKLADLLCNVSKANIIISNEVIELYASENQNATLNDTSVYSLFKSEEHFIESFFDYLEANWNNTNLGIDDFCIQFGFSKSKLYRTTTDLFGKSPVNLLKDYRLNQSLKLLRQKPANISEVAFETGHNSPSYFTKCFHKKFGLSPKEFIKSQKL